MPDDRDDDGREKAIGLSADNADARPVDDDELVFRHIPGGVQFQNPPDKPITSENFRLRPGERGISVSRSALTTPRAVLARLGDPAKGSRIAACRVTGFRALGFDVVSDPIDDDPGHALIPPGSNDLSARTPRKRLANLFRFLDLPEHIAEGHEDQP